MSIVLVKTISGATCVEMEIIEITAIGVTLMIVTTANLVIQVRVKMLTCIAIEELLWREM